MNNPSDLTSFVGRAREIALLESALSEARLVTLTGAAGSGKTRLAMRVSAGVASHYADGVRVVELATETEPDGIGSRMASSLGVTAVGQTSIETVLAEKLLSANVLIVLDNCEHLVEGCADLVEKLLRRCSQLSFLCTSQEPLSVVGECVVRVPPLQLAADQPTLSVTEALKSDAVRLFVDRCRFVEPDFELTAGSAVAVARICRRLDGLPLAIELAAARSSLFTPVEMLHRLEDRFRLLVGRSRTALSRHHTLRAAVAWSYDLLSTYERILFDRLCVFAGGFTIDAAEAVCAIEPLDSNLVVETLERLYLRSMLVKATGQPTRYSLLETLRQYAGEQLADRPEEATTLRERHCGYYLDLAISLGPTLKAPGVRKGSQLLESDVDNLRSALAWAMEHHPLAALQAVNALVDFWIDRSELAEGRRWSLAALEAAIDAPSADRDEALLSMARLNWAQGDMAGTRAFAAMALERVRPAGRRAHIADALMALSGAELVEGQADLAEPMQREALAIRTELGDRAGMAAVLNNLALIQEQRGLFTDARALANEALEMAKELENPRLQATIYESLGRILVSQGSIAEAHEAFVKGLHLAIDRSPALVAILLEDVATLLIDAGSYREALLLAGAAEALRVDPGVGLPMAWRERYAKSLEKAKTAVSAATAQAAYAEGTQLKVEDAVAAAVRLPGARDSTPVRDLLTAREAGVARLLMVGLSDKEIAKQLEIAPRTVQAHIDHIKTKLGVHTRAQIAVWFVENRVRA